MRVEILKEILKKLTKFNRKSMITDMEKKTENNSQEQQLVKAQIETAINLTDISKIYANGFTTTLGTGDVLIILNNNNKPIATLNLSYTVAKTLAIKLGQVIIELEKVTGTNIMTTDQITSNFSNKELEDKK